MWIVIFLLLMNQPQPRALLGASQGSHVIKTQLGISVDTAGFHLDKPKKMTRTIDWMVRRGYRPDTIQSFGNFALLLADSDFIPREIDKALVQIQRLWLACSCGGKHRRIAESFEPASLRVIIEDRPFQVGNQWAKGAALNGNTVRVAIICFYDSKPPAQADLRDFRQLAAFEIGNIFGQKGGYFPDDSDKDVGAKSPCGIF
jgi:hypothetical protein